MYIADHGLPLSLLLRCHHFEVRARFLLGRISRTLLGNLAPTTTTLGFAAITRREADIGRCFWNDALVGKLTAADEFLGESPSIKGLGVRVDGLGENLRLGWQLEQVSHEIVDCRSSADLAMGLVASWLTIDATVEALT